MRLPLLCCFVLVASSACTWVKMEPGGSAMRVARVSDDLAGCAKRGEVGVAVKDKVGLYQRNELKVRDELETMARNEAASLGADTVQALNEPSAGEQRFAAYACGRHAPLARSPAPVQYAEPAPEGDVQTYPLKDD